MSEPLCLTDPTRFLEAVLHDDPLVRAQELVAIEDRVVGACLRHGIAPGPETIPAIVAEYEGGFLDRPLADRHRVYDCLVAYVRGLPPQASTSLFAVLALDPDTGLASTATIDYASLAPLIGDDPMTGPRDVLDVVARAGTANPGAVLGGLLGLNDPRVCALIAPLRHELSADVIEILCRCATGVVARCVALFSLDWIEEVVDRRDDAGSEIFHLLVAGLHRLVTTRQVPFVVDGLRPFPVPPDPDAAAAHMVRIEMEDFARSIAERLFDIEAREARPRLFPHVIRAFGLEPRTPVADILDPTPPK